MEFLIPSYPWRSKLLEHVCNGSRSWCNGLKYCFLRCIRHPWITACSFFHPQRLGGNFISFYRFVDWFSSCTLHPFFYQTLLLSSIDATISLLTLSVIIEYFCYDHHFSFIKSAVSASIYCCNHVYCCNQSSMAICSYSFCPHSPDEISSQPTKPPSTLTMTINLSSSPVLYLLYSFLNRQGKYFFSDCDDTTQTQECTN